MTPASETLGIILGASDWPEYPGFETAPAFQNSANFLRDYLLRSDGFGLPKENLLWLFDDNEQPAVLIRSIRTFLRGRATEAIRNVLLYYVGHGGYMNKEYFVALRCTSRDSTELTTLQVRHIAKLFFEEVPDKRHILILDACYASGAVKAFITQDAGVAIADVRDQVRDILPTLNIDKGSALFCAAGPKIKAKAPWEAEYTMFSGALQRVLITGDPNGPEVLSLEEIAELVEKDIRNTFRAEAVRPELHTPRQEKGDISKLRFFPNAARRTSFMEAALRKMQLQLDGISEQMNEFRSDITDLRTRLDANEQLPTSAHQHDTAGASDAGEPTASGSKATKLLPVRLLSSLSGIPSFSPPGI